MARYDAQDLEDFELGVFLTTNGQVSAGSLGTLFFELERLAKQDRFFGPEAELRIVELGLGSVRAKLAIFIAGVAAAGTLWGAHATSRSADASERMVELQEAAAARAQHANSYLGQCLAEMYLDNNVAALDLTTADGNRFIKMADLPSVEYVQRKRLIGPLAKNVRQDTVDIPLVGRVGVSEAAEPEWDKGIEKAKSVDYIESEARTAPRREGASFRFEGDGDLRGAKSYLGRFAKYEDGLYLFNAENGRRFGVIWDGDLLDGESPELLGVPVDDRVMVRAQLDPKNNSAVVFEFYPIELP